MRDVMRPQSEPDMRIADATDGRTNGTKKSHAAELNLEVCNARGSEDGPRSIGELLRPDHLWPTERHPVIRTGERAEIPPHVRAAVWFRDRGKCELCNAPTPEGQPWHLDHITPWSAGGSDDTTNLRVLCERHNMDRGNRVDPTERPRRAATWWCINCYDLDDFHWTYTNGIIHCGIHRVDTGTPNPWRCRVVKASRAALERREPLPMWHQRSPIVSADVIAYCAHCHAPGLTSVAL